MGPPIRVLIADDEELVRSALAAFFADDPRFVVVATAEDANSAASMADEFQPDVALLDVRMPGGGGVRAAQAIQRCAPATRVIALSAHDDRDTVLEMLGSGAIGYVVKGSRPMDILDAAVNAANGLSTLSPAVASRVVEAVRVQLQDQLDVRSAREAKVRRIEAMLQGEDVRIAFQPVWNLAQRRVVGYEALSRFSGLPPRTPDQWFADAEDCGRSAALEMMSVRLALAEVGALPDCDFVAVNLSPAALLSAEFDLGMLAGHGAQVIIEITEHAPVADYAELNARLDPVRARGVQVAVDDAGSGYASFRHILNLSPDMIKLDLSLTAGIDHDPRRQALAAALIAFGAASGATVVGEGVETQAELHTLTELGVTLVQGYLLGRPQFLEAARQPGAEWPGAA